MAGVTFATRVRQPAGPCRRIAAAIGLSIAVVFVGGCASLAVDSDVSTFSRWPVARKPSTYAFDRLPSQLAQPQSAQLLEDSARLAVERAGFAPAADKSVADVTIQLGARITEYDRSPFDDPLWYGPRGPFHAPFFYGGYRRGFGPGWRRGWGGYGGFGTYGGWGYGHDDYVEREVALLIRDRRSGEALFEARATSEGRFPDAATTLPAMFVAAMREFPAGQAAPHRVRVEPVKPN